MFGPEVFVSLQCHRVDTAKPHVHLQPTRVHSVKFTDDVDHRYACAMDASFWRASQC